MDVNMYVGFWHMVKAIPIELALPLSIKDLFL